MTEWTDDWITSRLTVPSAQSNARCWFFCAWEVPWLLIATCWRKWTNCQKNVFFSFFKSSVNVVKVSFSVGKFCIMWELEHWFAEKDLMKYFPSSTCLDVTCLVIICETLWEALTICCSCVGISRCDQYTHVESTSNDVLGVHIAVATCSVSCWQPVLSFLALHFADALDLLRDMLSLALLCCSVPVDICLDVLLGFCLIRFRSCLAMYFESPP